VVVNEIDSIEEINQCWLHFDEYVVQDVISVHHPRTCVVGYMEWFRGVSHPYIIQMAEDDRPPVVPPETGTDEGRVEGYDNETKHFATVRHKV